jgi:hypothetical protein
MRFITAETRFFKTKKGFFSKKNAFSLNLKKRFWPFFSVFVAV